MSRTRSVPHKLRRFGDIRSGRNLEAVSFYPKKNLKKKPHQSMTASFRWVPQVLPVTNPRAPQKETRLSRCPRRFRFRFFPPRQLPRLSKASQPHRPPPSPPKKKITIIISNIPFILLTIIPLGGLGGNVCIFPFYDINNLYFGLMIYRGGCSFFLFLIFSRPHMINV